MLSCGLFLSLLKLLIIHLIKQKTNKPKLHVWHLNLV